MLGVRGDRWRSWPSASWSPGRGSIRARLDPVERVADAYLKALVREDAESARRLGTVEEPPAIRSVRTIRRDRSAIGRSRARSRLWASCTSRSKPTLSTMPRSAGSRPRTRWAGRRDARRPARGQGRRREIGPLQEDAERRPRRHLRRGRGVRQGFHQAGRRCPGAQENPADLPDAGRVGQAAVAGGRQGPGPRGRRIDAELGTPCSSGRFRP